LGAIKLVRGPGGWTLPRKQSRDERSFRRARKRRPRPTDRGPLPLFPPLNARLVRACTDCRSNPHEDRLAPNDHTERRLVRPHHVNWRPSTRPGPLSKRWPRAGEVAGSDTRFDAALRRAQAARRMCRQNNIDSSTASGSNPRRPRSPSVLTAGPSTDWSNWMTGLMPACGTGSGRHPPGGYTLPDHGRGRTWTCMESL
jgi:hypothetical protein